MQKKGGSWILVSVLVVILIGTGLYIQTQKVRVAEIIQPQTKIHADYNLDIDRNGIVNLYDYIRFMEYYNSGYDENADFSNDNEINDDDFNQLMSYTNYELGDNLLPPLSEGWGVLNEDRNELDEINYVADDNSPFDNIIELSPDLQKLQLITDSTISVNGGDRYVVSGWIKTDSEINSEVQVAIDGYDSQDTSHWYEYYYVYPNNKWAFFKKEIRIPGEWDNNYMENRNVKIWIRTGQYGNYQVGDIQLRRVNREFQTINQNENLLLNSEFNSGLDRIVSPEAVEFNEGDDDYISTKVDETYFSDVKLDIPGTYTLSAYIKSNEEQDATAAFWIYKGKQFKEYRQEESFTVSNGWQRYSYTFNIEEENNIENEGGKNVFFPGIYANHGSVSIDKIQLEKGELSDYKLNENVIINLRTDKYANIFFDNDDINFYVSLENGFETGKSGAYEIYVTDYNNNLIYESSDNYDLDADEFYERRIDLNDNNGHFRVKAVVKDSSGNVIDDYVTSIAKVNSIFNNQFNENSNFGINSNQFDYSNVNADLINQRYNLIKESGAKWVRIFLYWNAVEKESAVHDWDTYDILINSAYDNHMNILLTEADGDIPQWAEDQGITKDSENYRTFIRVAVTRYADRISAFEIENEPYLIEKKTEFNSNQEYIRYYSNIHADVSNRIRMINPNIKLVANVGGLDDSFDYFEDMSDDNLLTRVDAVSLHLYPKPGSPAEYNNYEETIDAVRSILTDHNANNVEIWQTEAARFSDDLNPDYFPYIDRYNRPLSPESFAANMWIRDAVIKKSLGIKHDFYFTIATQSRVYTYYNLFNGRWLSPKLLYPAYNTLSNLIDKSAFVEKIEPNSLVDVYVFNKGDYDIAVLWNIADNNKESNFIADSDLNFITQYDFVGNEVNIEGSTIKFNSYPNYLVFGSDNLDEFREIITNSDFCSACNEEQIDQPLEPPESSSEGSQSSGSSNGGSSGASASEADVQDNNQDAQDTSQKKTSVSSNEEELFNEELESENSQQQTGLQTPEKRDNAKIIETGLTIGNIILGLLIIFVIFKIIIFKIKN
ncbi:beta-galactosidase [Candidatus Woesearchaeota archaeon]|nr:beta-galactosidase [Candidatus Woesearchaeota archaeon]